jgi:hypothetical protein
MLFSRTSEPISIKRGTTKCANYLCIKQNVVCVNKGSGSLQREDNHKNAKKVGSSKFLLLKKHKVRKTDIYIKASGYSADSKLYKSWSPGVGWGHNEDFFFYMCLYWKQIFFSRINQTLYKSSLHKGNWSLYKWMARGDNCKKCKNTVVCFKIFFSQE